MKTHETDLEEGIEGIANAMADTQNNFQAFELEHKGLEVTVLLLPGGGMSIRTELGSVPGWYEDIDAACAAAEYMIRYPARFEAFIDLWESPRRIALAEMEGIPNWRNPQIKTIDEAYSLMKLYTRGQIVPKAFRNNLKQAFIVSTQGKATTFTQDCYVVKLIDGKVMVLDPGYYDHAIKTLTDVQIIGCINYALDQINTSKHTLIK